MAPGTCYSLNVTIPCWSFVKHNDRVTTLFYCESFFSASALPDALTLSSGQWYNYGQEG